RGVGVSGGGGEGGGGSVGDDGDPGSVRGFFERAISSISKEPGRAEGIGDEDVRPTVSVDVSRRDARRGDSPAICGREARLQRNVSEVSVAVVLIKDRANAVRNEKILEPVAVVVEHRDAGSWPDVRDQMVGELQRRIVSWSAEAAFHCCVSEPRRVVRALLDVFFERNPDAEGQWARF